jgi:hypothetical protein
VPDFVPASLPVVPLPPTLPPSKVFEVCARRRRKRRTRASATRVAVPFPLSRPRPACPPRGAAHAPPAAPPLLQTAVNISVMKAGYTWQKVAMLSFLAVRVRYTHCAR